MDTPHAIHVCSLRLPQSLRPVCRRGRRSLFNPRDVYSGKIGAARTSASARLPIISSSCLIQMVRSCQMMGQRQRAAYQDRLIRVLLIHLGIVLEAFGTNRWFPTDVDQGCFMRL